MARRPATEAELEAFKQAYDRNNGDINKTAAELGEKPRTLRDWRTRLDLKQPTPLGHSVKGVSTLVDGDGNTVLQWIKTSTGGLGFEETVDILRSAFDDAATPLAAIPEPTDASGDLMALHCLPDLHMGMYAWKEEAEESWDLSLADSTIKASVERLMSITPSCGTAVILGGGDQLHADNTENRTMRSGNALDVDGRFSKVLLVTCKLFAYVTELALLKHSHVFVRILPGNHDPHAAVALAYYLLAWFRENPRVTVDVSPDYFWWFRFGKVMLGATHGHMAKPGQMPGIMAERRPEDWGATRFRYCHTFHVHHQSKVMTEGGGVVTETHQTPIPKDAWHHQMGYLSGRSLQSIIYSREHGEVGRQRVSVI